MNNLYDFLIKHIANVMKLRANVILVISFMICEINVILDIKKIQYRVKKGKIYCTPDSGAL